MMEREAFIDKCSSEAVVRNQAVGRDI